MSQPSNNPAPGNQAASWEKARTRKPIYPDGTIPPSLSPLGLAEVTFLKYANQLKNEQFPILERSTTSPTSSKSTESDPSILTRSTDSTLSITHSSKSSFDYPEALSETPLDPKIPFVVQPQNTHSPLEQDEAPPTRFSWDFYQDYPLSVERWNTNRGLFTIEETLEEDAENTGKEISNEASEVARLIKYLERAHEDLIKNGFLGMHFREPPEMSDPNIGNTLENVEPQEQRETSTRSPRTPHIEKNRAVENSPTNLTSPDFLTETGDRQTSAPISQRSSTSRWLSPRKLLASLKQVFSIPFKNRSSNGNYARHLEQARISRAQYQKEVQELKKYGSDTRFSSTRSISRNGKLTKKRVEPKPRDLRDLSNYGQQLEAVRTLRDRQLQEEREATNHQIGRRWLRK
jgi:hypothetical protein